MEGHGPAGPGTATVSALERIRELCRSLPQASERHSHDFPAEVAGTVEDAYLTVAPKRPVEKCLA